MLSISNILKVTASSYYCLIEKESKSTNPIAQITLEKKQATDFRRWKQINDKDLFLHYFLFKPYGNMVMPVNLHLLFFWILLFNNLYTQIGAHTYNPKIKSHMF